METTIMGHIGCKGECVGYSAEYFLGGILS